MLKKKDWKELLQEFIDKVDKREVLIQGKIDDLREQEEAIQTKIKDNSGRMIELEMDGDTSSVAVIKKENRDLRIELEEIQDSIEGYKSQLGNARDYYATDLEKIRDAANKAEEERIQQEKVDYARLDELQANIDELKEQMEKTRNNLRSSRTTFEDLKWQFHHIDRRVSKLPDYDQAHIIKRWLAGDDVEKLLKKDTRAVQSNYVTRVD